MVGRSNNFFLYLKTRDGRPRPYVMKLPELFRPEVFLNGCASVHEPVECFTYSSTCVLVVSFVISFGPGGVMSEDEGVLHNLLRQAAEWFHAIEHWEHVLPADSLPNVEMFVCRRTRVPFDFGAKHTAPCDDVCVPTAFDLYQPQHAADAPDAPDDAATCLGIDVEAPPPEPDHDVFFSWTRGTVSPGVVSATDTAVGGPPLHVSFFRAVCDSNALDLSSRFKRVRRYHVERNQKRTKHLVPVDYTALTTDQFLELINFKSVTDVLEFGDDNLFGF